MRLFKIRGDIQLDQNSAIFVFDLHLFQQKTLLEEKTVIVELGGDQPEKQNLN